MNVIDRFLINDLNCFEFYEKQSNKNYVFNSKIFNGIRYKLFKKSISE